MDEQKTEQEKISALIDMLKENDNIPKQYNIQFSK